MVKTSLRLCFLFLVIVIMLCSCKDDKTSRTQASQYIIDSIYSKYLSEYRKHDIYLPQDFNEDLNYPIIYGTDGSSNVSDLKSILDSLIGNAIIKPVIFVASHSNGKVADSTTAKRGDGTSLSLAYRYFEYTNQYYAQDSSYVHLKHRFANHMDYFSEEFIPQFETKYKQEATNNSRFFYGVSNGAGFGMSLLNTHPNRIGTYLCFSIFGGDIQTNTWNSNTSYPNLYIRYGSEEPFFLKDNAEFLQTKYQELNRFIDVKTFNGGHSDKFWKQEFINILSEVLKKE
ncbi:alpha/beta hydrolase-fold protein [Ichthyenterobacterium sp. W332]|uniref:Alpha/beta hydrolase-fold protein n=1 Tax=Microcosmobacter mediterraneus TaxID=3075607 RepID=A0ABU2YGF7_9FLAO|nr:alpha/beta hydrolase-fold protein [Ichthyenterobacterium sp. W332]MDT0557258.1 alpha/beta hydrolase-fold protein [Ichthyenterobacterium sp. W332]